MPIQRVIDHDSRIVTTRCEGVMTDTDIQVTQRTFWAQDWAAAYAELFDMRAADFSGIVGERSSRYAAVVASDKTANLVPVAMVFDPQNEAQTVIATRYVANRNAMSDEAACAAFEDTAAAEQWLRSAASDT